MAVRCDELSLQSSPGSLWVFSSCGAPPEPADSGGAEHSQADADAAGWLLKATSLMVVCDLATHEATPRGAARRPDAMLSLSACETVKADLARHKRKGPNQTDEHAAMQSRVQSLGFKVQGSWSWFKVKPIGRSRISQNRASSSRLVARTLAKQFMKAFGAECAPKLFGKIQKQKIFGTQNAFSGSKMLFRDTTLSRDIKCFFGKQVFG